MITALLQPRWARELAGSPYFAALTAASAAVVGLLGSVYQQEIATAFPLTPLGPFSGFSWHAAVFWTALVLLAWLVFLRQLADDAVRNQLVGTTAAAESTSRRIEDLVQTLPPAGFQSVLTRWVVQSNNTVSKGLPRSLRKDLPATDLPAVVRALLNGLASLALTYDGGPLVDGRTARYGANIMLFVSDFTAAGLRPVFFPAELDLKQLKGVLLLRTDLSATSEGDAIDPGVPSLVLPVPMTAEREGRWIALLGGPRAFLTGAVDGYVDTSQFAEECRRRGDFQPSVLSEITAYFSSGPGSALKSFVSRRLEGKDGPIGVLNLHANRRDLLGPRVEKRETFYALSTPLFQDLEEVLDALLAATGPCPPATPAVR